jgi:cytochrome P450
MLNSDLPESEKSINNMWQEGQNVVGAGSDTTAIVLSVTTFHLLNNPDKLKKLRGELRTAASSLPEGQGWNLATIRQLPYLVCLL